MQSPTKSPMLAFLILAFLIAASFEIVFAESSPRATEWHKKYNVDDEHSIRYLNNEVPKAKGNGFKPFMRSWSHFYERAYPTGKIPLGYQWEQYNSLKHTIPGFGKSNSDNISFVGKNGNQINDAADWSQVGTYNTWAGRIASLAIDPNNANTIYVGAATGGIWKTTDGANTWFPLEDQLPSLPIGAIGINPNDTQEILIGTGEGPTSFRNPGVGLFRSTDGGTTWNPTGLNYNYSETEGFYRIVFHPTGDDTVFAATTDGLKKFDGNTWNDISVNGFTTTDANDFEFKIGDPSIALCAIEGQGIFRSTDHGNTWGTVTGLPSANVGRIAFNFSNAAGFENEVFAVIVKFGNPNHDKALGVYKSTDSGASWNLVSSTDVVNGQGWYNLDIIADRGNHDKAYIGGLYWWRTTDGGTTWNQMTTSSNVPPFANNYVHTDQHVVIQDPSNTNTFFVGCDGGFFKTTDDFATFTDLSDGLEITQFNYIDVHPTASISDSFFVNAIVGGTQDNGLMAFDPFPFTSWVRRGFSGDGGKMFFNYNNPDTVYATHQNHRHVISTDGAVSFGSSTNPFAGDRTLFYPPLEIDPVNPTILYAGTFRIWKTTDGTQNWNPVSNDVTNGTGNPASPNDDDELSAIAIAPNNTNRVYSGSKQGRFVYNNDGYSTTGIVDVSAGLPNRSITDIEVHPNDFETLYVTFSGFDAVGSVGHVFRSDDSGANWENITPPGLDHPVNSVKIDPAYTNNIYIGTDLGIFFSSDEGQTWFSFDDGLPNVIVRDLKIKNGTLVAGTYGRGVWKSELARPNIASAQPFGWSSSIIARNDTSGAFFSNSTSQFLDGNTLNSYFSFAIQNIGDGESGAFWNALSLDTEGVLNLEQVSDLVPGVHHIKLKHGPFIVKGGRHTIADTIDVYNELFETNENDNIFSEQFVWSPEPITAGVSIQRSNPPKPGNGTYANCDGFSYFKGGFAFAVGMLPTLSSSDYDLRIFSDYTDSKNGFSVNEGTSSSGAGFLEMAVGTFTGIPNQIYPGVFRYTDSGAGNFRIEAVSAQGKLVSAFPHNFTGETIDANHILQVYEVDLTAGESYDFYLDNLSGNADLGMSIFTATNGIYTKFEYEEISSQNSAGQDESFTFVPTVSGWHVLSVWKSHKNDLNKNAVFDLEIKRTPTNLIHISPSDWDYSLVVRDDAVLPNSNVTISPTLPGNTSGNTYLNLAYRNNGLNSASSFVNSFYIDGEWKYSTPINQLNGQTDGFLKNLQVITEVKGGRHTVTDSLDVAGNVEETNENDNFLAKQYVWSPLTLTENTPTLRTTLPTKNSPGYIFYNCDGFEMDFGSNWWMAVGTVPNSANDDIDLRLHNDYTGSQAGFGSNLAYSSWAGGETDFVIVNKNMAPNGTYYFGAIEEGVQTGFYVEGTKETGTYTSYPFEQNFTIGNNSILRIHEFFISQNDTGCYFDFDLENLNGNADLGFTLYDKSGDYFKKSDYFTDVEGTNAISYTNGDGQDESFQIKITESGYYGLAVWKRYTADKNKIANYDLKVRKSPSDLATATPQNWSFPLTPTNSFGATTLTTTLDGNAPSGTFLNFAVENVGINDIQSSQVYFNKLLVDDDSLGQVNSILNFDKNEIETFQDVSVTIKGGRHTLSYLIDSEDNYEETDETNNDYYKQFIWSPMPLANGIPVSRTSPPKKNSTGYFFYNCDGFETQVNLAQWTVVGVLSNNQNDDYDIRIHNDYVGSQTGFGSNLAYSGQSAGNIDFVLARGANQPVVGTYNVGVLNENEGKGDFVVESKVTSATLSNNGTNGTYSLAANELLDVYEVQLFAGNTYYFLLNPTSGSANLGFSLYSGSSPFQKTKSNFEAMSNSNNGNGGEVFSFTPTSTTFYGIVVWKDGSNDLPLTSDYEIIVTQTPIHNFTISTNGLDPNFPVNLNYFKFGQVQNVQISGEFSDFVDDGTNINLDAFTFAGTDERFMTQDQSSWQNVTASFTANLDYFRQWRNTYSPQVFAGGNPLGFNNKATFESTLFGAKQTVESYNSTQFFVDDSSVVIVFNETTGSSSDERWAVTDFAIPFSLGQITSGSNTIPVTFFHQLKPNVNLVGTDATNTTNVWDRLSFGSLMPEFGVHTSWTGFCDRGSLLAFETFTSQNFTTTDTTIFTVDSVFDTTITYAQVSPQLPTITDLQIDIQGNDAQLTWSPVVGAIAYNVYGTDGTGIFYIATVTTPDFLDVGAVNGNEMRFYAVTALDNIVVPAKPETSKKQNSK